MHTSWMNAACLPCAAGRWLLVAGRHNNEIDLFVWCSVDWSSSSSSWYDILCSLLLLFLFIYYIVIFSFFASLFSRFTWGSHKKLDHSQQNKANNTWFPQLEKSHQQQQQHVIPTINWKNHTNNNNTTRDCHNWEKHTPHTHFFPRIGKGTQQNRKQNNKHLFPEGTTNNQQHTQHTHPTQQQQYEGRARNALALLANNETAKN